MNKEEIQRALDSLAEPFRKLDGVLGAHVKCEVKVYIDGAKYTSAMLGGESRRFKDKLYEAEYEALSICPDDHRIVLTTSYEVKPRKSAGGEAEL